MCHHLYSREWETVIEAEEESELTEPTDDEVSDEPERREPAILTADD